MFSIEQIIYIKMDLALNNLQRLICHKTHQTKWIKCENKINILCFQQLIWWLYSLDKHWLLWYSRWRCISAIFVYTLLRLCTSNVNRLNKRKWFHIKKRQGADYANDQVLLTNTPVQAESLLRRLEQATGGISLYVNANKIVCAFLNKK